MKAVILAGGYATRLRPISYALPKLLFPVLGKPMIYLTLDKLESFGVKEVVLGVNYLANALQSRVGDRYKGMSIRYSLEDSPLGTAGPIKLASGATRLDETFIAVNGDVIADIDFSKMLKDHHRTRASVTDALHEVNDPRRFGVVQLGPGNRIRRFVEKPTLSAAPSRMVNAGIYLIEPEVLRLIPRGRRVSLEREIFPILAGKGKLFGFPLSGYWFDVGSFSDYRKANFALLGRIAGKSVIREKHIRVAKNASLNAPALVGEFSNIESKASVGPSVLMGKTSRIMHRAKVSGSILFDGVTVGEDSIVSGAILASNVTLGKAVRVGPGSILSPNIQVADGVKIGKNSIIHPYKEITANTRPRAHVM